jgi:putative membrane protein
MMQYEPPRAEAGGSGAGFFEGRLHPLTLLLGLYKSVRRVILPLIPLLIFNRGWTTAILIALLVAASLARALARYFTFSYRVEGGELITREGLFERTERHIPLERIQEIRIEQGVIHRLFGVADASVETAGGQRPEATLSVLSLAEVERLRQRVFEKERARKAAILDSPRAGEMEAGHKEAGHKDESRIETSQKDAGIKGEVIIRLRLRDLILAGLTSNHVLSALVLVGTFMAFVDDLMPASFYERATEAVWTEAGRLAERGVMAAVVVAAITMILFFIASLLLSVTGSVALFYNFTLARAGEDLHRSYGLLTKRASSLPRRRIQLLEIKEGALRRPFKLVTLRADTAGSNFSESGERNQGQGVLLPIAPRDGVGHLLGAVFPDLKALPRNWSRCSRLAVWRETMTGAVVCLLFAAAIYWFAESLAGLWALTLVLPIYVASLFRYRALGYNMGDGYFYMRHGWPGRSTLILPIRNVQAVTVRRSPIDRKLGLATLSIDSAGQSRLGGPQLHNLPVDEAHALGRTIASRAASTQYRW